MELLYVAAEIEENSTNESKVPLNYLLNPNHVHRSAPCKELRTFTVRTKRFFQTKLAVVTIRRSLGRTQKFFIGTQLSDALGRKSFNLYRCVKSSSKFENPRRATLHELEMLQKGNHVTKGTHSVTLIPYVAGLICLAKMHYPRRKKTQRYRDPSNLVSV